MPLLAVELEQSTGGVRHCGCTLPPSGYMEQRGPLACCAVEGLFGNTQWGASLAER